MSTKGIYGDWDNRRTLGDALENLWHMLAAQKVGTPQQQNHNGLSQRKNEIIQLWEIFMRQRPSLILEVGTAQGGTFASWCYLAPDTATLISIDRCLDDCLPRPGEDVHRHIGRRNGKRGIRALGRLNQTIHGINGWTYEPSTQDSLAALLNGRKIDFIFHDASHEAGMFAGDFQWLWPLVAEGGIFASHDVAPSGDLKCNKVEEWSRIKREETYSACYEFLPHPSVTEMGIGVLIK